MTQRERDEQFIESTLESFKSPPFWLDAALARYAEVKDDPERVGVCHDIAVAIIRDLHEHGSADGWIWCKGTVDGGFDHSWVECRGLRIDMGNSHELRVRAPEDSDTFRVDDVNTVVRRDGAETARWAEDWAHSAANKAST